MTSGGTESILLACKAARDYGRKRGITKPEMLKTKELFINISLKPNYF